ncbi:MAG: DUF1800 family protein [Verrucomicrobiales bacterium]|nr:DUF1800 family protein [Verrucomicrobiales bacterium]
MESRRLPGCAARICRVLIATGLLSQVSGAEPPPPPRVAAMALAAGEARFSIHPSPATDEYRVLGAPDIGAAFTEVSGIWDGFDWTGAAAGDRGFFRVEAVPLSDRDLLTATVLNRLAYGPTPDDLARVRGAGPEAYIAEQLSPEAIPTDLDVLDATPRWTRVTASGLGSASKIYIYLNDAGEAYLDDLRLVAGNSDDGSQPNLLRNGGFETSLSPDWRISPNLIGSARSPSPVHSGNASLHVVSTEAGETQGSSIYQLITPDLNPAQTYTLSYWYYTSSQRARLTVRLSGSGIESEHGMEGQENSPAPLYARLQKGTATRADLRAWHLLHAIQSPRQLTEVLRQFLENHFVTQVSKTQDYFDNRGYGSAESERLAVRTEFVENVRWRDALLKPDVTFEDLLRISAESPAMIVYLDTVTSRGDGSNVANENYARELCELFCFGVDNGYSQKDIEEISRAWTGWRLELVDPGDEFNPFAARSTHYLDPNVTGSGLNANTNVVGVWAFKYRTDRHNNRSKNIFFEWNAAGQRGEARRVPARYGPPWAGRPYGLTLAARTGNAGMQDGYDILRHMANQPFTEEFLSVKLCQWFVHDGFQVGYDFTDDVTSPEEELVHACMLAWENGNPRGQLRPVLNVIFNSELFRGHGGSLQKVKTPLEFAASTVRALRARRPDGTFTAESDGYGLYNMMNRAGRMRPFDRAEPNGYPEDAPGWISGGTLSERLRFVQAAMMPPGMDGKDDAGAATRIDPVGLLQLSLPASSLQSAPAVADYLVRTLFPGEGAANLAGYRAIAVQFLDTGDDGKTSSPLASLNPGSSAYDLRIRGLAALLLTTQRFQEQ